MPGRAGSENSATCYPGLSVRVTMPPPGKLPGMDRCLNDRGRSFLSTSARKVETGADAVCSAVTHIPLRVSVRERNVYSCFRLDEMEC